MNATILWFIMGSTHACLRYLLDYKALQRNIEDIQTHPFISTQFKFSRKQLRIFQFVILIALWPLGFAQLFLRLFKNKKEE